MLFNEKEKNKITNYIISLEKPEGGFSFSKTTPPTLEDTYFALMVLGELDQRYISAKTMSYIRNLNPSNVSCTKHLYYLVVLSRIGNLLDLENSVRFGIMNGARIKLVTLLDLYYFLLTKEKLNFPILPLKDEEKNLILSVEPNSMEDYKQIIILKKKIGINFDQQRYIDDIRNAQNNDGGFGLIKNSTSFLEPTYHALKALKELWSSPKDMHKCDRFVRSCLTNMGGFGRHITTVPSIEYSYYAVKSLKILDELRKIDKIAK